MWGFGMSGSTHSLFSGKLEGWSPQGAPQGDYWTISSPLIKNVCSSIFFLLLAEINFTSPDSLMKIMVSHNHNFPITPKGVIFFMSEGYLHLAEKSAWPWKAISQQRLWSLCSLRPQQSISCPCLSYSKLPFFITAFYYHDAHGNPGPKVGVGAFSFFISEEKLSIFGGWFYTPLQGSLLV